MANNTAVDGKWFRLLAATEKISLVEGILVSGEFLAGEGLGDRETGGNTSIQQTGRLEFVDTGQVANRFQPEVRQEGLRRAVGDGAPWRLPPSAHPQPAALEKNVESSA